MLKYSLSVQFNLSFHFNFFYRERESKNNDEVDVTQDGDPFKRVVVTGVSVNRLFYDGG